MPDALDWLFELLKCSRLFAEYRKSTRSTGRVDAPTQNHPAGETESESPRKVLILGAGGVGKSTLARYLCADYRLLIEDPGRYVESIEPERIVPKTADDVEFIVLPGQRHRRPVSWPKLLDEVALGNVRGILLMSAFGYHSLGATSYKSHRLYQSSGRNRAAFMNSFLQDNRDDELQILDKLIPALLKAPGPVWMLSLVTKQDLWWKNRQKVESWYRHGPYSEMIGKLSTNSNIRHEFALASLAIRNLETGQGELLANTSAGYDQVRQVASMKRLIDIMEALIEWEREL